MPAFDIERLAIILRDAAKAEILPRFRRLAPDQIKQKSEAIDLVTEADTEAERWIKAEVAKLAPNALFVGEESVSATPALLQALDTANLAVVVDPVDGTANFAAGLPLYAVMAAVVDQGETVAGIIYDPMGDDWILAEKGSGAFQRRPDGTQQRLHVAAPVPLSEMVGTVSIAFIEPASRPQVLANLAKIRLAANYRCAGHDYRLLAGGHTHFTMYNKLMPWDHLGGTLIVQEAGGFVAHFDGSPYLPHEREGGLVGATDRDSFELLSREVFAV
jgi:fructose-1,6-bisphosphatase/inositol monophosphatase family enzyme